MNAEQSHRFALTDVVLDARTLQAHLLKGEAVAAARTPGGRYVATCGAEILPIDGLTEPPQGHCQTWLPIPAPKAAGMLTW
jgi:hypothetical protein